MNYIVEAQLSALLFPIIQLLALYFSVWNVSLVT